MKVVLLHIVLFLIVCIMINAEKSPVGPHFLEQPKSTFVVENAYAELSCSALHADSIYFICNKKVYILESSDGWSYDVSKNVQNKNTGQIYSIGTLRVKASDVKKHLENDDSKFFCACQISDAGGESSLSEPAYIEIAFIEMAFEKEPMDETIEAGSGISLDCDPPKGYPQPTVKWVKNNRTLVHKDGTTRIHESNLIIVDTKIVDTGNYTCVASNIAGVRRSTPSNVKVYIDGGWASWSTWSDCDSTCGRGNMMRSRTCTKPAPVYGKDCENSPTQEVECTSRCPQNGLWSEWQPWAVCSPLCKRVRIRNCDNPSPAHEGLPCVGPQIQKESCSGGHCSEFDDQATISNGGGNSRVDAIDSSSIDDSANIAIYVSVAVVAVIFILLAAVISCFVCKKKRFSGYHHANRGVDMTATAFNSGCTYDPFKSGFPINLSNDPGSSVNVPIPSPHPPSCFEQLPASRPPSFYDVDQPLPPSVPSNIDPNCLAFGTVGHAGGRLCIPDSGISLLVPEGAILKGHTEEMYIAVSRDEQDRPRLTDIETLLSSIILTGPCNLHFTKPIIVSFIHCATMEPNNWLLSVVANSSQPEKPGKWTKQVTVGQETINTPIYCQVDERYCFLMVDQLSARYALVGQSNNLKASKLLKLAAFAQPPRQGLDFNIRVYCVDNTQDALEAVIDVEHKLGGQLLDTPRMLTFKDGAGNLCLQVDDVFPGWRSKLVHKFQEIPFKHVWSGIQATLHASFALEHVNVNVQRLSCRIHVYQSDNNPDKQTILVATSFKEAGSLHLRHLHRDSTSSLPDPAAVVFRIPGHVRSKLCQWLDPPSTKGNDWRLLAKNLEVDRYINYFATKSSPTEHILDLWEARCRDDASLDKLVQILKLMGQTEASCLLELSISQNNYSSIC